jgi:hypothetical protein
MIDRNPIDVESVEEARERFESKYDERIPASCWPWEAGTFGDGYGRFTLDGRHYQAHRIAWALANGSDPGDALVLHECYNESCVNPAHLMLGNQRINMVHAFGEHGSDVFSSPGEENPNAELTSDQAREIRERYESEDVTQADLADEFGVSRSLISMVVREVLWADAY